MFFFMFKKKVFKMDKLLVLLAALHEKSETLSEAIKVEEDKAVKKEKLAELRIVMGEINDVTAEIEEAKEEEILLAKVSALSKPGKRKTAPTDGGLDASNITTHDNVYDDPKLGFKCFGDVAQAVYKAGIGASFDERLRVIKSGNPELQAAGLRQGNGPDGGYLVPTGVRSAELQNEQGMSLDLFSMARGFNLSGESAIEIPAINETSRKSGSQYGGVTHQWLEEEEQMNESEPQFRQVELKPKESGVFIKSSNKLLRNSPVALGQFLDMASRDVMRFERSNAVMNGNGAGKPLGFLNSAALVTIAKESGQTNGTVVVENTLKMLDSFTERWLNGSLWLINKRVQSQLSLFKIGDHPVFIPGGSVAGQPLSTLHGIPIMKTEYNPILGAVGDICLVNMQAYLTATQGGGVSSSESIHFFFDTNKTAFKFIEEVDGQTWLKSAITDFQGSGTSSPFVTLAAR